MRRKRKELLSEKLYMKRILAVYFAVHILLFSAFALVCGAYSARRGTEKVWRGTEEYCIFIDDIHKWLADMRQVLHKYYNSVKYLTELQKKT